MGKENTQECTTQVLECNCTETDDDAPTSSSVSLPVPPDGGYGWVVCAASFVSMIILDGVMFAFGVFFIELLEYFKESRGKTAMVGSLLVGVSLLGGPVVSALVNWCGCRAVTISGSLIASGAFLVSIFVPSVDYLILTYGIVGGFGFSMMYLPSIIIVGLYFEKRRAIANGFSMCGSGIGTFLFATLCTYLQNEYTWRGGTLILSGVLLHGCVVGALFRPLEANSTGKKKKVIISKHREQCRSPICNKIVSDVDNDKAQSLQNLNRKRSYTMDHISTQMNAKPEEWADVSVDSRLLGHNLKTRSPLINRHISQSHGQLNYRYIANKSRLKELLAKPLSRSDIFYGGSLYNIPEYQSNPNLKIFISKELIANNKNLKDNTSYNDSEISENKGCTNCLFNHARCLASCNMSAIMNRYFGIFCLSTALWAAQSIVLTFIAPYAVYRGISREYAALLLASAGVANIFGRALSGVLADRPNINCVLLNAAACIIGGVVTIIIPLSQSFWLLALEAAAFGLCMAHWVSMRAIVLVYLLGISNLTNSLGLLAMCQGIAFSVSPPLAGLLFDQTESYLLLFSLTGIVLMASGALCIVLFKMSGKLPFTEEEISTVKLDGDESTDTGVGAVA